MFPISNDRRLTILDIANYWSREPRAGSKQELRTSLIAAWWRGEFCGVGGWTRLEVLRDIFQVGGANAVFVFADTEAPPIVKERDDGGADVDLRPRIPVPHGRPEEWNDENCGPAFIAMADAWKEDVFPLQAPVLTAMPLTCSEFIQWIDEGRFDRPKFWRVQADANTKAARSRYFTPKSAEGFVARYIADEEGAHRTPTQAGLEKFANAEGFRGTRDILRDAYHRNRQSSGLEVRPGRTPKPRAEK